MTPRPALLLTLLALTIAALALSGIAPHDRLTWWMETAPVFIGAVLLVAT
jgi:putative membrane protein